MDGRQLLSNMNFERRNPDSFGDTRDKDGANRRICVSMFDHKATVRDFLRFFGGEEKVEGVTINRGVKGPIAFIQFKRPKEHTEAILNSSVEFLGRPIKIRNYVNKPPPSKRAKSPPSLRKMRSADPRTRRRSRSRSRSPNWNRSRTPSPTSRNHNNSHNNGRRRGSFGSPDRERVRRESSPSLDRERLRRERSPSLDRATRQSNPFLTDTVTNQVDDYLVRQSLSAVQSNHSTVSSFALQYQQQQFPIRTSLGGFNGFTSSVAAQPSVAPTPTNATSKDLPADVGLVLKLILEHGTARNLSTFQINTVIQHLEDAKKLIERPMIQMPPPPIAEPALEEVGECKDSSPADGSADEEATAREIAAKLGKWCS